MTGRSTRFLIIAFVWAASIAAIAWLLVQTRDQHFVIAAGPRTSESFHLATAIADVIHERRSGMSIEVFETQGSSENVRLIESGHADFATVQADVVTDGSVHAIASLYFDAYQLIVTEDSKIRRPPDLAGHRVAIGPANSGQNRSFWRLIEHYELTPEDLIALPMATEAANFAMIQRQVDAVFRVRAIGNGSIRELVEKTGLRLIPISQAAALAIQIPTIRPGEIPSGAYRGNPPLPTEDLPTAMIERFFVARADLDPGIVYAITDLLFEQRSSLVAANSLAGFISAPDVDAALSLAVHRGAQNYYDREKPNFWQQNTRIVAPTLYVIAIVTSTAFGLRARIQRRRKVRMGDYNLELLDIAEDVERSLESANLHNLRGRLVSMLRSVVEDLNGDRVSQDEFEHFSFTWGAVDNMLRDRLILLGDRSGVIEEKEESEEEVES